LNHSGGLDAFVAKVHPDGTSLLIAGMYGGTANDYGTAIALDDMGFVYITGYTNSDEATFPVINWPYRSYGGNDDAFVAMINPTFTDFIYSGYIGGNLADRGMGIAVDYRRSVYVAGLTASSQTTFPEIIGPDVTQNGGYDAFALKINYIYRLYLPINMK
jgi:hypothetical protein